MKEQSIFICCMLASCCIIPLISGINISWSINHLRLEYISGLLMAWQGLGNFINHCTFCTPLEHKKRPFLDQFYCPQPCLAKNYIETFFWENNFLPTQHVISSEKIRNASKTSITKNVEYFINRKLNILFDSIKCCYKPY